MKVGAEPKKLAVLGGLAVVGMYLFYANVLSDPARPVESTAPSTPVAAAPPSSAPRAVTPQRRRESRGTVQEFRPSLKPRRPEDRIDPMSVDPSLRLDLLARVQAVEPQGGTRNLFQFAAPPATPAAKLNEPLIVPVPKPAEQAARDEAKPAEPPPSPGPPPINLKYYGYSTLRGGDGRKRAFFLDGEDILVAAEGETVKRRYKVVRIGVSSVVMEDTESKNQQTLPLQEEALG